MSEGGEDREKGRYRGRDRDREDRHTERQTRCTTIQIYTNTHRQTEKGDRVGRRREGDGSSIADLQQRL